MNTKTLQTAKTLRGLTMDQVLEKLQEKLPDGAYSDLPGRSDLTSINPHYTLELLTQIFGPFGIGFGLEWEPENLFTVKEERQKRDGSGTYIRWVAGLDHAMFWFLLDGGDEGITVRYPISSGSENEDRSYAIRGARTNALQDGATKLLYQIDIFKKKKDNASRPVSQSSGEPITDPGGVIVPFKKAKELFGGQSPTIAALYEEDPDFIDWICDKIHGDIGDAAQQYRLQQSGKPKPTAQQPSGNGDINTVPALMDYAKSKGHTFAHPGKLLEYLDWSAVPKPDQADMWAAAIARFDGDAKEGEPEPEPFRETA